MSATPRRDTAEHARLAEARGRLDDDIHAANPWYGWGPYLSERAWGTVREDYSADGNAWDSFPHDHARSRAYRWNEDGMAGLSDIGQELCLALALWNGTDPILKERMFGLTGPQGNHGEDVKEYWWYLDGLPSHALLQWRYHYPQAEFPYERLVTENGRRGRDEPEYELLDTGVFDDDRYWIVDVTYAKASPEEILASITVRNRAAEAATLHVLPTLWFRNTWRWSEATETPVLRLDGDAIVAEEHPRLGGFRLEAAPGPDGAAPVALFCDNETNTGRLWGTDAVTPHPKDGIGDHVISGAATVDPDGNGTKAAWWYRLDVPAGGEVELRLRLHRPATASPPSTWAGAAFDDVLAHRRAEADEFYDAIAPPEVHDRETKRVIRQAAAGLIWSKQFYPYSVARWLDGDPGQPPPPASRLTGRNAAWRHLDSFDILAMPDPWEYPWFAAWDLAFHAVAWAHLDPAFAKYQVSVLLREWFLHPNGALPSYEWNFDDVNPPVHAMAAIRVFAIDGGHDVEFLERVFQKLLVNFTWWLNRQDPDGNNVFGGGFLGLDNISPIDRSNLPEGARIEQVDGTAWMAFYSLSMLLMSLRLADERPAYEDMVVKFLEHFALITDALDDAGLFDADDGFFYDRLLTADGSETPIRVRTLVGAIPILPSVSVRLADPTRAARLQARIARLVETRASHRRPLAERARTIAGNERVMVSVTTPDQLRATLTRLFDEDAFLSPHGLRALSKEHLTPYEVPGVEGATIRYEPAESSTAMYGGNSNWRGPIWFPVNYLVIRSLQRFHYFLGDELTMEYPTGTGKQRTLGEIAQDLTDRLLDIWRAGPDGRRPVFGGVERMQHDPDWRDNLLFFEYFNGDDGAGLGAMHQTGWTAVIIDLLLDRPDAGTPAV
ncbi:MAG: glucosidase [Actinomycetota bacterium]|nr:glucosidase [Actinomycetota bacterium]